MKKYTFILLALVFSFGQVIAQDDDPAAKYASTITVEDLTKHLTVIASDEFQGRETGEKGLDLAAEYIVNQLRGFGIAPVPSLKSYYQPVAYKKVAWGDVTVNANGEEFRNMRDFYSFASINENIAEIKAKKVMFLGYGIDDEKYSDYKGVDVKDKVLIVYPGEPKNEEDKYWISGTSKKSKWSWRRKLKVAKDNGAKLVLFIEPNTLKNINRYGRWLIEPSFGLYKPDEPSKYANHMFISPTMLKTILGKRKYKKLAKANKKITKTGKPVNFKAKSKFTASMNKKSEKLISNNILAYIEGSDDAVKDEVVVITAHYDHVGYRGEDIFNGADDDGSGTTALIEMAQAFQNAKKAGEGPRRSVLLLWVAGEEKGLLGSKYYTDNPIFPLENTVADVNIDMIGRVDKKYEAENNPNYIYVIGSDRLSTDLHKINEEANKKYTNLTLDYTYNDENDPNRYYYRSDHYNFAKHGIPSIFFFNGTHADYHKSTDTIEKINFPKMHKIVTLIFHTAWELANREERIKVDVEQKP